MGKRNVIEVENLGKRYRLGVIGGATLSDDLKVAWASLRGKPNPLVPLDDKSSGQVSGDHFWALRNLDFQVEEGEILGIIGHNGAGKSTLLKLLSRITLPTEGSIRMKGRSSSLLEVGTGFHPELTGRENIFLNGAILGMNRSEINTKIADIIEFSGIKHHIDTPTKRYSSGMKVRLGFSVAAHLEPEILIVDEVLAVGDADFQRRCMGKMKDVASSGRTILFVSHNMLSIRALCSRVIHMEAGAIKADGETETVVSDYLKTYFSGTENITWSGNDRPGTDLIRMNGVSVQNDSSDQLLTWMDPFSISVDFEHFSADTNALGVAFHLYNSLDVVVFAANVNESDIGPVPFGQGRFKVSCKVPGNLLNAGDYRVQVLFFANGKSHFVKKETIGFRIEEVNNRTTWFGKKKGILRTRFEWTVE
jgi:lipopolysaccharide transport system ATP-binding protein